ncbi:HD domain-containing protein [Marinococcus luteus]|uniref:HD domain-containing protein n=2 Tax=Marinococcus luteus TaxID=1122204 RepID=A0A1H2W7J9_9BACI|nr:HD domain-containing protein [Marinococcus luteus]
MAKATGTLSDEALLAILQHHEREDGSSYPLGMKNGKIYVLSSLLAAADMYHSMAAERRENEGKSAFHAMRELTVQCLESFLPP